MERQVKRFCITINNYTTEEEETIKAFCKAKAVYAIIGKEISAEGTPHIQGFINLNRQSRFTTIKKIMPRAHIEEAQGTDEQNKIYCSKEDKNPYEIGEPQYRGKRSDLSRICTRITEGATMQQIAIESPADFVRYNRGLSEFMDIIQIPRKVMEPPITIWLYGESGVGKTRFAYDHFSHEQIYMKDGTSWWNGYMHQQVILIDDFDGRWPFRDFLRFLDRYPYRAQVKGGYVQINSPIIVVTCEFAPSHFWEGTSLIQIERRIQHLIHIGETSLIVGPPSGGSESHGAMCDDE